MNAVFTPGTLVVCQYRMPSVVQPWIHEIQVGVVVQPGIDPEQWNGSNSEQSYCELTGTVPVQYAWGIQHDKIDSLMAISDEEAKYSFREKIAYFLGRVALTNYDRAMGIKEEQVTIESAYAELQAVPSYVERYIGSNEQEVSPAHAEERTEITVYTVTSEDEVSIKVYCEECKSACASQPGTLIVSGYDNFCQGCGQDFKEMAEKKTTIIGYFNWCDTVCCACVEKLGLDVTDFSPLTADTTDEYDCAYCGECFPQEPYTREQYDADRSRMRERWETVYSREDWQERV